MNILFVLTPAFDPYSGGVQMSTYKIGSYLARAGHELTVYSFENKGNVDCDFGVLHHAPAAGGEGTHENLRHFSEVIQNAEPDVVINQMPYIHDIGEVLKEKQEKLKFLLLGCLRNTLFSVKLNLDAYRKKVLPAPLQPLFANAIGRRVLLWKHRQRHCADLKEILDTYDYFIMFAPPNETELEYFVGDYKKHKTAFIPNSIPKVLPEVPTKEKRMLWLSRLSYAQKRADLILPFWKKVMHHLPDWQFDVVGHGDAFEDIKNQIEKEQIPRITLHGKQKPDDYYRRAPIYIMTSAYEGFPNTLIEAQSFGAVPIVYRNYPVVNWVIEDGKNGHLIPPFDIDQMAQRTIALAQDVDRRQQMMEGALENARRFTIDRVGQKWVDFFAENGKQ